MSIGGHENMMVYGALLSNEAHSLGIWAREYVDESRSSSADYPSLSLLQEPIAYAILRKGALREALFGGRMLCSTGHLTGMKWIPSSGFCTHMGFLTSWGMVRLATSMLT